MRPVEATGPIAVVAVIDAIIGLDLIATGRLISAILLIATAQGC